MLGTALMIHPNSPDWRALGTVFAKNSQGSIVEVERTGGPVFTTKEAAERHGLVLCQGLIEEKLQEAQDQVEGKCQTTQYNRNEIGKDS